MGLTDVRPVRDDLPFGIRLGGVTRELLEDPSIRQHIDALFIEHGMIVFEGVEQSDEMQLALSSCFGPLKEHPVKAVSRVDGDAMPGVISIHSEPGRGVVEVDGKQVSHWLPWHYDHCYNDELNRAGVLRSVQRTEEGGITGFMDGITLYKAFPKDLLARIEGKDIVYTLSTQYDELQFGKPSQYRVIEPKPSSPGFKEQARATPRAIHPAVWTRPTGEKVLHVSHFMARGISGMENEAGNALLEEVCQTQNQLAASCSYQHKWREGDMAIWGNLRMLHCVSGCNPQDRRLMYRTTIKGDYGHGRWDTVTMDGTPAKAA